MGGGYDLHNQPTGNYAYDSIGNLIRDSAENIAAIKWNVYGKITEIDHRVTSLSRPTKNIYYFYDAAGHRIGKKITRGDTTAVAYTWYVRDASGNVMATYTASIDSSRVLDSADLKIGEKHLYGSSRLGILTAGYSTDANTNGMSIYTSPWTGVHLPYYSGRKQYELSNHLGNVLATITDKKIGVSLATDSSLIDHYEADVQTAQDYYPFGMVMPGRMFAALSIPGGSFSGQTQVNGYTVPVDLSLNSRSGGDPAQYAATRTIDLEDGFTSSDNDDVTVYLTDTTYQGTANVSSDGGLAGGKYRYGFNGKENDNEVKGVADQIDYGMRVYDPRVGKFLSVDPIAQKYPELTPYQFASNTPIAGNDLDGKEVRLSIFGINKSTLAPLSMLIVNSEARGTKEYLQEGKNPYVGATLGGLKHYGSGITAGLVGADLATGANVTRTVLLVGTVITASNMIGNMHAAGNCHNEEAKKELMAEAKSDAANLIVGYVTGKVLGYTLSAVDQIFGPTVQSISKRLGLLKTPAREVLAGEDIPLTNGKMTRGLFSDKFDNVSTSNYGDDAKKYLWTIDENGINIGLEKTSIGQNSVIKHTNLSSKAYAGGELWFTDNNTVHINAWSGRFGAGAKLTAEQWQAAQDSWKTLGYKVIAEPYSPKP